MPFGTARAKALGHTSFSVTKRHYVDREVLENASLRKNLQVLQGSPSGNQSGNCQSESVTAHLQTARLPLARKRKPPEIPGVFQCEEGDSNPHGC
jgi:hypothetical protein